MALLESAAQYGVAGIGAYGAIYLVKKILLIVSKPTWSAAIATGPTNYPIRFIEFIGTIGTKAPQPPKGGQP